MRVLMVGSGGVGTPLPGSPPTSLLRAWVVADYDLTRAQRTVDAVDLAARRASRASVAAQVDASDAGAVAALARERGRHPRLQRGRPAVRAADLRGRQGRRRRLPRHGDEPVQPAPERALREGRRQARRRPVRAAGEWEADGRLALVGIGVEPGLSDVFARYAADHLFSQSTSWAPATVPTSSSATRRATRSSRPGSRCGRHRGVPQPARGVGARRRWRRRRLRRRGWFYTPPPFAEPEVFDFPVGIGPVECVQRRARGGAPHAALGRGRQGHLQVRPGRRVHLDPAHAAHARARRHRPRHRQGRAGRAPATSWPRHCPTPRRSAPRMERQDVRRAVGDRHRQGRPAAPDLPLPRVRQRRDDARTTTPSASSGRRPSTRSWRSSCSRPGPGRAPACSAPRRSTPCRSSTCWPRRSPRATAPPGASRTADAVLGSTRPARLAPAGIRSAQHTKERRMAHRPRSPSSTPCPRGLLIGGQWREASGGETIDVARPERAAPTLTTSRMPRPRTAWPPSPRPTTAQAGWAATPPRDRGEILRRGVRDDHRARRRVRHADDPRDGQDRSPRPGVRSPTAPSSSAGSPRRPCASPGATRSRPTAPRGC